MSDLEDGEINDTESDNDSKSTAKASSDPGVYNVVERPVPSAAALKARENHRGESTGTYRSSSLDGNNSSESNSHEEDTPLWKQKKEKFFRKQKQEGMEISSGPLLQEYTRPGSETSRGAGNTGVKKVNNVWGSVLQEQDLTQTLLKSVAVDKNEDFNFNERNVESYDFTKRLLDTRPYLDNSAVSKGNDLFEAAGSGREISGRSIIDYEDTVEKSKKQKRGTKRKADKQDHGGKSIYDRLGPKRATTMQIGEVDVKPDMEAEELVKKIGDILNEPKLLIIERVVEHMGKEMAIKILNFTRDVEASGGMLTFDGSRRRTAGGVFIQLLKQQSEFTPDVKRLVFKEEYEEKKKQKIERRKRSKAKSQKKKQGNTARNQPNSRSCSPSSRRNTNEGMDDDHKDSETKKFRNNSKSDSDSDDDNDDHHRNRKSVEFNFEKELAAAKKAILEKNKAVDQEMEGNENGEDMNDLEEQASNVVDIPLEG